jgi:hypothetical protein
MLDGIVSDRSDQQMRRLEQRYFDAATAGGRVSPDTEPVAQVSPASSR